ncbi:pyridoxamine 5'-phosphate oxidase family protein [Acetobacterium bakii]|uniref:pyridoxamine 5'-phosphate oxidase family protein n=1 Tax=Acetobacterium bakii TaxID=52689 RepID=UPI000683218A|nr:pyridoxamine 5'-phosphate oxidase family protein [Acetobacterium bakii]
MLEKVEKILRENTLCVLCTEGGGKPYCSLMTYIPNDDLRVLYMVSTLASRKFKNLLANPRVSVLVDTRQNPGASPEEKIASVTFEGSFQPLAASEMQRIKTHLADDHLELNAILENPNCVVFSIKLNSYLLLDGPIDSFQGNL